jgi:hypothetical protein
MLMIGAYALAYVDDLWVVNAVDFIVVSWEKNDREWYKPTGQSNYVRQIGMMMAFLEMGLRKPGASDEKPGAHSTQEKYRDGKSLVPVGAERYAMETTPKAALNPAKGVSHWPSR